MRARILRFSGASLCCCVGVGAYIAVLWACKVVLS